MPEPVFSSMVRVENSTLKCSKCRIWSKLIWRMWLKKVWIKDKVHRNGKFLAIILISLFYCVTWHNRWILHRTMRCHLESFMNPIQNPKKNLLIRYCNPNEMFQRSLLQVHFAYAHNKFWKQFQVSTLSDQNTKSSAQNPEYRIVRIIKDNIQTHEIEPLRFRFRCQLVFHSGFSGQE